MSDIMSGIGSDNGRDIGGGVGSSETSGLGPMERGGRRTIYSVRPMMIASASLPEVAASDEAAASPSPSGQAIGTPSSPAEPAAPGSKLRSTAPVPASNTKTLVRRVPMTMAEPSSVTVGAASTKPRAVAPSFWTPLEPAS